MVDKSTIVNMAELGVTYIPLRIFKRITVPDCGAKIGTSLMDWFLRSIFLIVLSGTPNKRKRFRIEFLYCWRLMLVLRLPVRSSKIGDRSRFILSMENVVCPLFFPIFRYRFFPAFFEFFFCRLVRKSRTPIILYLAIISSFFSQIKQGNYHILN